MTPEQAKSLKSFAHYCTCGGYAYTMNGRNPNDPHMEWCLQRAEWLEWKAAIDAARKL